MQVKPFKDPDGGPVFIHRHPTETQESIQTRNNVLSSTVRANYLKIIVCIPQDRTLRKHLPFLAGRTLVSAFFVIPVDNWFGLRRKLANINLVEIDL